MWKANDENWEYKCDSETKEATGKDKECTKLEEIGTGRETMSNDMQSGEASTIFKQSFYVHAYKKEEFSNNKYYDLIFKNAEIYWLAGRYSHLYSNKCEFGVQLVDSFRMHGHVLCLSSDEVTHRIAYPIRPIVTIDIMSSNCKITPEIGEDGKTITKCTLDWNN